MWLWYVTLSFLCDESFLRHSITCNLSSCKTLNSHVRVKIIFTQRRSGCSTVVLVMKHAHDIMRSFYALHTCWRALHEPLLTALAGHLPSPPLSSVQSSLVVTRMSVCRQLAARKDTLSSERVFISMTAKCFLVTVLVVVLMMTSIYACHNAAI